ncbi:MAG: DUF4013 domain-containing protein [Thermosynechococcaceae cyanobacterium]
MRGVVITDLMRALRYPWRGEGWFWQMLPLALLQLVPLIGQIILVGYGQAVVRAIYRQQHDLPRLHLRRSLVDGLRLTGVGFVYGLPVILMVLLAFSTSDTSEAKASGGIPAIVYPAIMLIYLRISSEIIKRRPALKSIFSLINRIISAIFGMYIILRLYDLLVTLQGGGTVQRNTARRNGIDDVALSLWAVRDHRCGTARVWGSVHYHRQRFTQAEYNAAADDRKSERDRTLHGYGLVVSRRHGDCCGDRYGVSAGVGFVTYSRWQCIHLVPHGTICHSNWDQAFASLRLRSLESEFANRISL